MYLSWVITCSMSESFLDTTISTGSLSNIVVEATSTVGTTGIYTLNIYNSEWENGYSNRTSWFDGATFENFLSRSSSGTSSSYSEKVRTTVSSGGTMGWSASGSGTSSFSDITTSSTTEETFTAGEYATDGAGITTVTDAAYQAATTSSYSLGTTLRSGSGSGTSSWTATTSSAYLEIAYLQTTSRVPTSKTWSGSSSFGVSGSVQSSFNGPGSLATVYRMAPGFAAWVASGTAPGLLELSLAGSSGSEVTVYPFVQSSRSYVMGKATFSGSSSGSTWTVTLVPSTSGEMNSLSYGTWTKTVVFEPNYKPVVPTPTTTVTVFSGKVTASTWSQAEATIEIAIPPISYGYEWRWMTTCSSSATYGKSVTTETVIGGSALTTLTTESLSTSFTSCSEILMVETASGTQTETVLGVLRPTTSRTWHYSRASGVTVFKYTTGCMALRPADTLASESWAEWASGSRLPGDLTNTSSGYTSVGGLAFPVPFSPGTAALGNLRSPYPVSVVSQTTGIINYGTDYSSPTTSYFAWKASGNSVSATRTSQFSTISSIGEDPGTTTCISQITSSCSGVLTGEGTPNASICGQAGTQGEPWIYGGEIIFPGSSRSIQMGAGVYRKGTSIITSLTSSATATIAPSVSILTVVPVYSVGVGIPITFGPITSGWTGSRWRPLSYYTAEEE